MKSHDEMRGEMSGAAMLSAAPDERAVSNAYVDARDCFFCALAAARQDRQEEDVRRVEAHIALLDAKFRSLFTDHHAADLAVFTLRGERAYDAMYAAFHPTSAAAHYSDAKDFFASAAGAAQRCGRDEEVRRLTERLNHIRRIYRQQFP